MSALENLVDAFRGETIEIRMVQGDKYMVCVQDLAIKDVGVIIYAGGHGRTVEDAVLDYIERLRGKDLVLHPYSENRTMIKAVFCNYWQKLEENDEQSPRYQLHGCSQVD